MPVEDTHARNELEAIFKALLADNSQAWELDRTGPGSGSPPKKATAGDRPRRRSCAGGDRARRLARAH